MLKLVDCIIEQSARLTSNKDEIEPALKIFGVHFGKEISLNIYIYFKLLRLRLEYSIFCDGGLKMRRSIEDSVA